MGNGISKASLADSCRVASVLKYDRVWPTTLKKKSRTTEVHRPARKVLVSNRNKATTLLTVVSMVAPGLGVDLRVIGRVGGRVRPR